jgi:hypothetical protein
MMVKTILDEWTASRIMPLMEKARKAYEKKQPGIVIGQIIEGRIEDGTECMILCAGFVPHQMALKIQKVIGNTEGKLAGDLTDVSVPPWM